MDWEFADKVERERKRGDIAVDQQMYVGEIVDAVGVKGIRIGLNEMWIMSV